MDQSEWRAAIEERLAKLEERVSSLEAGVARTAVMAPRRKDQSVKEFMLEKGADTYEEKVTAVAYFVEVRRGYGLFNVSDLKDAFRAAPRDMPKNLNDVCNGLVEKGWLRPCAEKKDNRKAWELTQTGIDVVQGGFSHDKG